MLEEVVLLDDAGNAIGSTPKIVVHNLQTPLHLAFSCYVVNRHGDVLITKRAATKSTWPGVWTNSCCGHPLPNEPIKHAIRRRLHEELGITATTATLIVPNFRYTATMDSGVTENEMCPVYRVRSEGSPLHLNHLEVQDYRWEPWPRFSYRVIQDGLSVAPWAREQIRILRQLGIDPRLWPRGDSEQLPPAAQF